MKVLDFLRERKTAYQLAMRSPAGQVVLKDLSWFCRANATCWNKDPRLNAMLEGRREVWLRIQQHLMLTPEELTELFGGGTIPVAQSDEEADNG